MNWTLLPALGISINEDVLFLIVFGVFGLIKFLTSKKGKDEETPPEITDKEQAQRTREIQEEIRRRIAENQKQPQSAPRPDIQPRPLANDASRRIERPAPTRREKPDIIIGRQIDYMQQLADARHAEEESKRKASEALLAANLKPVASLSSNVYHREGVLAMLNHPGTMRDAFIISEVLMPPVSERRNSSCHGLAQ
jgi:hypothetical protein